MKLIITSAKIVGTSFFSAPAAITVRGAAEMPADMRCLGIAVRIVRAESFLSTGYAEAVFMPIACVK